MQPEESLLNEEANQRFQPIVGSSMYLGQVAGYGMSYAAKQLARAMSKAPKVHMGAAMHQHRHLAGMVDFSITCKQGGTRLDVHSDSNWGNNQDNGESTSVQRPREVQGGRARVNGPVNYGDGSCGGSIQDEGGSVLMTELGFNEDFKRVPLYTDNTRHYM